MALKWGIASASKIAHDFVNALGTLNADEHQVVAVAARDLARAQEFAKQFDIPKAHGSYLELAQNPDVEIAYVSPLNPQHFEVSLLLLEHGKHVLCEKPMCMNEKQVHKLISVAKEKNVFLMEGIWSRFFPSYQYIGQQIESGKLGEIITVEAEKGNHYQTDRITKKELGGGIVLDIGVYIIQFCQWMFGEEPKSINANGSLSDDGVDVELTAELKYGGDKTAQIKMSALKMLNSAKIIGTKGTITVPALICPLTIIDVDGTEKSWPLPEIKYKQNFNNSCGLRYEADEVRKCIRAGKTECEQVSHKESIIIARIEDEMRRQIGVKDFENE